jgi:hypothetical protein
VLLEVGETAGHRVAARVMIFVWQGELDHRDVHEVVRHLVDEVRTVRFAVHVSLEVAPAEFGQASRPMAARTSA